MASGVSWSQQEIAATVADYMLMLQQELAGQRFNKTAHRRALLEKLNGRSPAAVEKKHQNISAVLRASGRVWINGYKPLSNVQAALGKRWSNGCCIILSLTSCLRRLWINRL